MNFSQKAGTLLCSSTDARTVATSTGRAVNSEPDGSSLTGGPEAGHVAAGVASGENSKSIQSFRAVRLGVSGH